MKVNYYLKFLFFFVLSFWICSITTSIKAQKNHAVYAELLGNGFIVSSLNYEYHLGDKPTGFGVRVGVSVVDINTKVFTIPIMANYLIGSNSHMLEMGMGVLFFTDRVDFVSTRLQGRVVTGSLMYRYHSKKSGFLLRAGIAPIFNKDEPIPFWPGISLGYRF